MKFPSFKTSFGGTVFILLILAALAFVRPAYKRLENFITVKAESYRTLLESKTGITFSYDSLSPSILSALRLKGIVLSDVASGKRLLSVKNLVFSYNLPKLLRGSPADSLENLSIDGLDLEWNGTDEQKLITELIDMIKPAANSMNSVSGGTVRPVSFNLNSIPFDISVKNSVIHYTGTASGFSVAVRNFLLIRETESGNFSLLLNGGFTASLPVKTCPTVSGTCSAAGILFPSLNGSSVQIRFHEVNCGKLEFNTAAFVCSYENGNFRFESLRALLPLYVEAETNFASHEIKFRLKTDRLNPFGLVTIKKTSALIKKLAGITTSISGSGSVNYNTGSFSYRADGSLYIPDGLLKGGAQAGVSLSGDERKVNVQSFELNGPLCSVSYSGSLRYAALQLAGTARIKRLELPGGTASADLYFDPLDNGFLCFSPQFEIGPATLTAVQMTLVPRTGSLDFSFEASDYSHPESDKAGMIKIDGSYLYRNGFVQAGVDVDSFYLDTALKVSAGFIPPEKSGTIRQAEYPLSRFIYSGELYLSSDMKTVSFSIPYSVIANTQNDRQLFVFALDGNNSSLNISRFEAVYGKVTLKLTAGIQMEPDTRDTFFTASVIANTIPYHFSGTLSSQWINITGDYGFNLSVALSADAEGSRTLAGSTGFTELPVSFDSYIFTASADSSFTYSAATGFQMILNRFSAEEPSGKIPGNPRIETAGLINKYGLMLNSISYTDRDSLLEGSGNLLWNVRSGIFDSANSKLELKSPLSEEAVSVTAEATNPGREKLSAAMLKKDLYFSSEVKVTSFPLSRFFNGQKQADTVSGTAVVNGTLESPYVSVMVDNASLTLAGAALDFNGSAVLEDNTISVQNAKASWNRIDFDTINAQYSLNEKTGSCFTRINYKKDGKTAEITAPVTIDFSTGENPSSALSQNFILSVKSGEVSGTLFPKPFPVFVNVFRTDGRYDVFSSKNIGLSGYMLDNGELSFKFAGDVPLLMNIDGTASDKEMNVRVSSIYADLPRLSDSVKIPAAAVSRGILTGALILTGSRTLPEINGTLSVETPEVSLPGMFPESLLSDDLELVFKDDLLQVAPTTVREGKERFKVSARVEFAGLSVTSSRLNLLPYGDDNPAVKIDLPFFTASGTVNPNVSFQFEDNTLTVSGLLDMRNMDLGLDYAHWDEAKEFLAAAGSISMNVDLTLFAREHVRFIFDPLLRCVVVPLSEFRVSFLSSDRTFLFDGTIGFKGGDITYLNRSFYIKDGTMTFNPNTGDARISLTAETRERDEDGNQVTITLSAENQLLSQFNPTLSASPAKSETEIMELLGQFVTADSSNVGSLLMATGDYYMQRTVIRQIENTLRDLLNFDIFSIRTQILQNAVELSFNRSNTKNLSAGNFFDNSTVYIGKYFGSSLYADALLLWTYDETKKDDGIATNGIVFQPEFGLEMSAPFANIRWNIAPDLDAIQNNIWVPSTSITLSWKFTF
ncbi:MAG: translocation/assembly module TamB [Treponema sp.]|jgi:hypothetical protein|nr:translocation/assembly module TamB [Treponema sp.]